MKKIFLFALILVVFAQWLVPGQMIWKWETVLSKGKVFKFQTVPVDPFNPIKGRYVALSFADNTFRASRNHGYKNEHNLYVELDTNTRGYAIIRRVHTKPPRGNNYYLQVKMEGTIQSANDSSIQVIVKYPFEEYFMDEFKAPKAERLYLDSAMRPELTYALVKVYKGGGVIQDLYINNRPVRELIK